MRRLLRILINILIFLIVAGFLWYIIASLNKEDATRVEKDSTEYKDYICPYEHIASYDISKKIARFEMINHNIYIATEDSVLIFDESAHLINGFPVKKNACDLIVNDSSIYLLFPTEIQVYSTTGERINSWSACSDNSNYCSFAFASGYIFVTDAENKNICKYTEDGNFVMFINGPRDFIIPSPFFDIASLNDTIYCVNPGKLQIESYTLEGNFIASFGEPGSEPGTFTDCCNPAYISFSSDGEIITSEKGIPRISCYGKNGKFKNILLTSKLLGGGNEPFQVKMHEDKLFVAKNKTISIFQKIKNKELYEKK